MDFSQFLSDIGPGGIGFTGLLGTAIMLVLTGKLVPKTTVDDIKVSMQSVIDSERADKAQWRTAYFTEVAGSQELRSQNGELLELSRTTDHLIKAIKQDATEAPK